MYFFFLQLQASSGEGAFVSVLFFSLPLLTLAFSSHHLPHVALADNRLSRRGEESDKRESKKKKKKRKQTQGCHEKGKNAPVETVTDKHKDSEIIEGNWETGS